MTNPASASNAWAKIQKKIAAQAGNSSDSASTPEAAGTPKPKATPGKKRGAKAVADDGETPVKKARTPKKIVKEEPVYDDEDASGGEDDAGDIIFQV
jgi:hypothetical protein